MLDPFRPTLCAQNSPWSGTNIEDVLYARVSLLLQLVMKSKVQNPLLPLGLTQALGIACSVDRSLKVNRGNGLHPWSRIVVHPMVP